MSNPDIQGVEYQQGHTFRMLRKDRPYALQFSNLIHQGEVIHEKSFSGLCIDAGYVRQIFVIAHHDLTKEDDEKTGLRLVFNTGSMQQFSLSENGNVFLLSMDLILNPFFSIKRYCNIRNYQEQHSCMASF